MIHTQRLGRAFGRTVAVEDVWLSVPDGTILALLSPDGAGKTRTVHDQMTPTASVACDTPNAPCAAASRSSLVQVLLAHGDASLLDSVQHLDGVLEPRPRRSCSWRRDEVLS